ncbi:uncharacterized protein N7500_005649 [Penicillium coprophilum]|uniref:uncharacterized protein n=1 Tax=Penicillium coprophilum TaxID=36646 RepID=UPI0023A67D5E|nr:uncharacterized protein N7500_005649 [Penicillium coprophilum]KAJ5163819.1 hypothetical protein N7500_005649 [Penicillium coprophilum]
MLGAIQWWYSAVQPETNKPAGTKKAPRKSAELRFSEVAVAGLEIAIYAAVEWGADLPAEVEA